MYGAAAATLRVSASHTQSATEFASDVKCAARSVECYVRTTVRMRCWGVGVEDNSSHCADVEVKLIRSNIRLLVRFFFILTVVSVSMVFFPYEYICKACDARAYWSAMSFPLVSPRSSSSSSPHRAVPHGGIEASS